MLKKKKKMCINISEYAVVITILPLNVASCVLGYCVGDKVLAVGFIVGTLDGWTVTAVGGWLGLEVGFTVSWVGLIVGSKVLTVGNKVIGVGLMVGS